MSCFDVPIVYIVFRRFDQIKKTFECIRKIRPERLYIISDGARDNNDIEKKEVESVREYLDKSITWCCDVRKKYAPSNLGCGRNIYEGITWVFTQEESAIIIEDDVLCSEEFFRFTRQMLLQYKDDYRVMAISGFQPYLNEKQGYSYFFSKQACSWGWGTWRRAWEKVDYEYSNFSLVNTATYYSSFGIHPIERFVKMIDRYYSVIGEENGIWDYQWEFSMAIHGGYCIYPRVNLTENIGFTSQATHTVTKGFFHNVRWGEGRESIFPIKHPPFVADNMDYHRMAFKHEYPHGIRIFIRSIMHELYLLCVSKRI